MGKRSYEGLALIIAVQRHSILLESIKGQVKEPQDEMESLPITTTGKHIEDGQKLAMKKGAEEGKKCASQRLEANKPVVPHIISMDAL